MKRLILLVILCSLRAWAQNPCLNGVGSNWDTPGNYAWCEITNISGWTRASGWVTGALIPDTLQDGRSYAVFEPNDDPTGHTSSPWSDGDQLYVFQSQPPPQTPQGNPYIILSGAGGNGGAAGDDLEHTLSLKQAIPSSGLPTTCGGTISGASNCLDVCVLPQLTPGTCQGKQLGSAEKINQSGWIRVDDELFHYTRCDEVLPTPTMGSCPTGASSVTEMNFIVDARAVKQAAGWQPASAHNVATWVQPSSFSPSLGANFACDNQGHFSPCNNTNSIFDHWEARHSVSNGVYDSNRGRVVTFSGWQENFGLSSMWYICLVNKASYPDGCGSAGKTVNIFQAGTGNYVSGPGWQRLPLATQSVGNGEYPGQIATYTAASDQITQSTSIYIPLYDEFFVYGGLESGNTVNATWVFCPSPSGRSQTPYGCNLNGGTFNRWIKIGGTAQNLPQTFPAAGRIPGWGCASVSLSCTPNGDPGIRNQPRAVWDSVDNKILAYGGVNNNTVSTSVGFNTVSTIDPLTGQVCISDKGVLNSGSNSTGALACPSQFNTAALNPPPCTAGKFDCFGPDIVFDYSVGHSARSGKMAVIYAAGINPQFYYYNYTTNAWSSPFSPPGGPIQQNFQVGFGGQGTWTVYDLSHDAYINQTNNGTSNVTTWELPGGAIDALSGQNNFVLSVLGAGTGSGTVVETSPDTQINCTITNGSTSGACAGSFASGTTIVLSESPTGGSTFTSWSGCDSSTATTCTINSIAANRSVTATFASGAQTFNLTETTSGTGSGTLANSPTGTSCGTGCQTYASGTVVTITETPASGSQLTAWGGACAGVSISTCTVTMTSSQSVSAQFDLLSFPLTVTLSGNGSGSVTSNDLPQTINCVLTLGVQSGTCSASYTNSPTITLTGTPISPSTFQGFTGSCTSNPCTLTMNAAKSTTGVFSLPALGTTLAKTTIK